MEHDPESSHRTIKFLILSALAIKALEHFRDLRLIRAASCAAHARSHGFRRRQAPVELMHLGVAHTYGDAVPSSESAPRSLTDRAICALDFSTALRDATYAHPTLAESLNNLFMAMDTA